MLIITDKIFLKYLCECIWMNYLKNSFVLSLNVAFSHLSFLDFGTIYSIIILLFLTK